MQQRKTLRDSCVTLFLVAHIVSSAGTNAMGFGLGVFAFLEIKGKNERIIVLAIIALFSLVAFMLGANSGGKLADRAPRWKIIVIAHIPLAAIPLGLWYLQQANMLKGLPTWEFILLLGGASFVMWSIEGFVNPAMLAFAQVLAQTRGQQNERFRKMVTQDLDSKQIHKVDEAVKAAAYTGVLVRFHAASSLGRAAGSGLAMLMTGDQARTLLFLMNAASYLFMAGIILFIQVKGNVPAMPEAWEEGQAEESPSAGERLSFQQKVRRSPLVIYLSADRKAMLVFWMMVVDWVFLMNGALIQPLVGMELFGGERDYALINMANMVGWGLTSICFSLLQGRVFFQGRRWQWARERAFPLSVGVCAACLLVYGLGIHLWVSISCMLVAVIPSKCIGIAFDQRMKVGAPDHLLGRLNGDIQLVRQVALSLGIILTALLGIVNLLSATAGPPMIALIIAIIAVVRWSSDGRKRSSYSSRTR